MLPIGYPVYQFWEYEKATARPSLIIIVDQPGLIALSTTGWPGYYEPGLEAALDDIPLIDHPIHTQQPVTTVVRHWISPNSLFPSIPV